MYLKLKPYEQITPSGTYFTKLSAKYYVPSQVLEEIGVVTYMLSISSLLLLHSTFHVYQREKYHHLSTFSTSIYLVPTVLNQLRLWIEEWFKRTIRLLLS